MGLNFLKWQSINKTKYKKFTENCMGVKDLSFFNFRCKLVEKIWEAKITNTCVQKFSNKHNFDHNFFVLQSFGFKFSGNLYIYYD
jgi:hypothetical protein